MLSVDGLLARVGAAPATDKRKARIRALCDVKVEVAVQSFDAVVPLARANPSVWLRVS